MLKSELKLIRLKIVLFIALCYRQLSVDIETKNFKIKNNFVSQGGPEARSNKTGFNLGFLF